MKLSDLNEYVRTAAALGAILALVAVGYEIRQSNRIAAQQNVSANYVNLVQFSMSEIESGISSAVAKAITEPEKLTLTEKIDLDSWLTAFIGMYEHDYNTAVLGEAPDWAVDYLIKSLADDSAYYFGNKFSRAWFEENKYWMTGKIMETVQEAINSDPLGGDLEYHMRIDAHIETMD